MHSCVTSKNVKWCHLILPTVYTESVQQLINFCLHFHQMAFLKEDKIFIKNLQQLKGYSATRFRTKNWTRAHILTILKRIVTQTL